MRSDVAGSRGVPGKRPGRRGVPVAVAAVLLAGAAALAFPAGAQVSPGKLARPHEKLEGPLNCTKCHAGTADRMDENCLSCHGEIARLRKDNRGLHARLGDKRCADCHPDHAGRDFELVAWERGKPEKFDHRRTGWPLEGKHATAACRDCHRPDRQNPDIMKLRQGKDAAGSWIGLETACASCHQDPHRGALGADCASCHGITAFKPAVRFDHARTGYPLTGKHTQVECARCHPPATATAAAGEAGAGKTAAPPSLRFKPVAHAECSDCHRDPHQGSLGATCSSCHTTASFTKVDAKAFRHDLTRFPLKGKHASVPCASCHDEKTAWGKDPPFARCDGCHRDPHAGTATLAGKSADCASCHDVRGFVPATFTVDAHAATRYPLEGKHREVACRSCHAKNPPGTTPAQVGTAGILLHPAFSSCRSCHGEAHGKQLASRPDGGACEACHTVAGFRPSRFGIPEHASLSLPLDGRHAEVACRACHGPDREGLPPLPGDSVTGSAHVLLALSGSRCQDCHVDPHHGRWPGGKGSLECRSCHDTRSFGRPTIGVAEHARFSFPLEGAHRAVPCVGCHPELDHPPAASTLVAAPAGVPDLPFGRNRSACVDCHENPHGDQFAKNRDRCERCHGLDSFRPASRFDHDRDAAFALRGGHEKVPCARCHPPRPGKDGVPTVVYRPLDSACRSCHGGKS